MNRRVRHGPIVFSIARLAKARSLLIIDLVQAVTHDAGHHHVMPAMQLFLQHAARPQRVPFIRGVYYEVLKRLETSEARSRVTVGRKALTLNVSEGGMLLLVERAVDVGSPVILDMQAFEDIMPEAGSLAEVAWTCPLFLAPQLHLMGLSFLL